MSHFATLFALQIHHAYYDGICRDFAFVLPRDTRRRMQGGRLVAKVLDGVLRVLFEADEDGAPLVSPAGKTLRIGLKPLDPHFGSFTDLGFRPGAQAAYYGNASAPGELEDPVHRILVGSGLSWELAEPDRPVTVTLSDASGQTLGTETILDERSTVSFDLTGAPSGACTVEELYPGDVVRSTACYVDPELRQEGVLCVVEILLDGLFPGTPPVFEVAFEARRETLKYYLVARNGSSVDLDQLSVSDAGFNEDGRDEVTFVKVPSAASEIPLLDNGDAGVVLFQSQDLVARQARGRRKIQLLRNGDVLVEHLPQPGPDRLDANLIVHVSKP